MTVLEPNVRLSEQSFQSGHCTRSRQLAFLSDVGSHGPQQYDIRDKLHSFSISSHRAQTYHFMLCIRQDRIALKVSDFGSASLHRSQNATV